MTRDEFFPWAEAQEGRYEFDGTRPVAMTGGRLGHGQVIRNITRQLGNRLAGKPSVAVGPGAGMATVGDAVRCPDGVVTCTGFTGDDLLVPDPVVVFEVVSPSSVRLDRVTKLREYQAVPSILRYVIVEPGQVAVTVLFRDEGTRPFVAAGLGEGEVLDLPEIGIAIPVADIYEGTGVPPHP